MFTRHQLYQLYEEGSEPTVGLIESLLEYIEEVKAPVQPPAAPHQRHLGADRQARCPAQASRGEAGEAAVP